MERKIKMKPSYFIKKKKEIKQRRQTASTQRKIESISHTKPNKKKTKLASDKLALKTRRFQLQKLSNNKAAKCQQRPAQPRAAEFHSLRRIKISDNSSQVSNFHFQISTLK